MNDPDSVLLCILLSAILGNIAFPIAKALGFTKGDDYDGPGP